MKLSELEALAKADDYSTMSKTVTVSKQDILQMIALIRQMGDALEFAADWAKPEDLNNCECPICKALNALKELEHGH